MLHALVGDEVVAVDVERPEAGIDDLVGELVDRYRTSCRYLITHLYRRGEPDRYVNRGQYSSTSPEDCSRALDELHQLQSGHLSDVEVSSLVDAGTGRVIARSRRYCSVAIHSAGRDSASYSDYRAFAVERRSDDGASATCFASHHFLQLVLPDTSQTGAYGLVDIDDEQQIPQLREHARLRTGPFAVVHPDQKPLEVTVREETLRQDGGTNVRLTYGVPAIATPCVLRGPGALSPADPPEHLRSVPDAIPFESLFGGHIDVLDRVFTTAVRLGQPVQWTSERIEGGDG
ncbi:hypothetical protein ACFRFQ_03070 [Rhodococcus sp. NPDC056743]|uniref:hypothetical protein n=1 Tax=Rhodococcus sp. NPDC056743 TaxID=3345934 RepID=UPI00366E1439